MSYERTESFQQFRFPVPQFIEYFQNEYAEILVFRNKSDICSITWQEAKMKNAFSGIGWENDIVVPTDYQDSELAKAFRKSLDILAIGPFDKNPYENE